MSSELSCKPNYIIKATRKCALFPSFPWLPTSPYTLFSAWAHLLHSSHLHSLARFHLLSCLLTTFFHFPVTAMRLDHLLARGCVQCPSVPPVCNCGPAQLCVQIAQYVFCLHIARAPFLRPTSGAVPNVAPLFVKTRKVPPTLVTGSARGSLQVLSWALSLC